jgi:magnesium-transporting ATPase (P-type)
MKEIAKAFWSVPSSELLQQLDTTPKGLMEEVANERLKEFGAIRLKPQERSKGLLLFLSQFKGPIIIILLLAAGLSFFLRDSTDALIILAIVLVSGLLGFWQEKGAANAIEKLLSIVQTKATVLRDGNPVEVSFEDVVPGDVVILSAGGSIPGDCMILESKDLFLNEAALTGKTYPVEKRVGNLKPAMHQLMAKTLDVVITEIKTIQKEDDSKRDVQRPRWPMIILRTPKGWTGPKEVDGVKTEGFWRSHQVPFAEMAEEARNTVDSKYLALL